MIDALLLGFCCSLIGVAYVCVISMDDTPLLPWFAWLHKMHSAGGWRAWISSPLGGCVRCCSGQIGLWSSLYLSGWDMSMWIQHLTCSATAILCAAFISKAYEWQRNKL